MQVIDHSFFQEDIIIHACTRSCVYTVHGCEQFMLHLSSLVQVDESSTKVVRVTVTYKRKILEKHSYIRDSWSLCCTQIFTIRLVIVLHSQEI